MFGSITKPFIEALLGRNVPAISDATDFASLDGLMLFFMENGDDGNNNNNNENNNPRPNDRSLRLLMRYPTWTAHYLWRKFDDKFMRPVFRGGVS